MELQVVYHLKRDERKHTIQTKPELHVYKATPQNRLYFLCLKSGQNSLYSRCFPKWIDPCSYGML